MVKLSAYPAAICPASILVAGQITGGGREAGGGSSTNGAKERADVGGGDGINGGWLDFSPGDRSPRGDLAGRTVPRPPGF